MVGDINPRLIGIPEYWLNIDVTARGTLREEERRVTIHQYYSLHHHTKYTCWRGPLATKLYGAN